MSRMGIAFLESFYDAYLKHQKGLAYIAVAKDSDKILGLIAGGASDIRSNFMRKARVSFLLPLSIKLMTDKYVRFFFIEKLRMKLASSKKVDKYKTISLGLLPAEQPCARLQVICVREESRGTGVSLKLMNTFRKACEKLDYRSIELSVQSNNVRALSFYKKNGWIIIEQGPESTFMCASASTE